MGKKPGQIITIDDSGDVGFKFRRASSRYFSIACVVFDDWLDAEEASVRIKRLRRKLGWPDYREFKFHNASAKIRQRFLTEMQGTNFEVWAIIVDKTKITDMGIRKNSGKFYNYIIRKVLQRHQTKIDGAIIRIDGEAKKAYKQIVISYLRKHINKNRKRIASIDYADSKENDLIQLADMVVGAIHRTRNDEKNDKDVYFNIIKNKVDLWECPE